MSKQIFLNVSFQEKDDAKALGARWNPTQKKWYITSEHDQSKFSRWLPKVKQTPQIIVESPYYIVRSYESCWKCGSQTPVYCLAGSGIRDVEMTMHSYTQFSFLSNMSEEIEGLLSKIAPRYKLAYSKQNDSHYYMNHCKCGAPQGDFFMHNEPGGSFHPISSPDASEVELIHIDSVNEMRLDASWQVFDNDLILDNAFKSVVDHSGRVQKSIVRESIPQNDISENSEKTVLDNSDTNSTIDSDSQSPGIIKRIISFISKLFRS